MSELIERQAAIDAVMKYCLQYDLRDLLAELEVMPSVQPDSKMGEWLHDLLQDAIDAGIITETQASRLMDRIAEDNT